MWLYIILGILIFLLLLILLLSYLCYRMAFYSKNKPLKTDSIILPDQEIFNKYKDILIKDIEDARTMSFEPFEITSQDGLVLKGRFFEYQKNAPIEIMFHGYRSSSERDLSSGIKRAFKCGHSALLIDQRANGQSEGHTISFGIKERFDCLLWAKMVSEHFGKQIPLILTGISMGATTVTLASCLDLPSNVIGILADCPFNNASEIIKKVIKDLKAPVKLGYFFVKLGAKIFGKFDLESTSSEAAVKFAKVPIIFFHGEKDDFVPTHMSKILYDACTTKKKLVIIPQAEHGVSYLVNPDYYLKEARSFFKEIEDDFYQKSN